MTTTNISREMSRLMNQMQRLKKAEGVAPLVLVLGSDAAPVSPEALERAVLRDCGHTDEDMRSWSEGERADAFKKAWEQLDDQMRFAILDTAFRQAEEMPSYRQKMAGYRGLARLCEAGYFNIIFTTNVDTMLEDAFIQIGLMPRHWQVFVNGRDSPDKIAKGLEFPTPRIKIVKLHGDLFSRVFAFGHAEVFQFSREIESLLSRYLSGSVLIVGNSMRDLDVNRCIRMEGGVLYYVNVHPPQPGTPIYDALQVRRGSAIVKGEEAEFGRFFTYLSIKLVGGERPEEYGLQDVEAVGIPIDRVPEEQLEEALASERPLIEFLSELEIKLPRKEIFVDVIQPTTLYVQYDNDQRLSFKIEGALTYGSSHSEALHLDVEELNRVVQFMGRDIAAYYRLRDEEGRASWRERAKREGKLLYETLFGGYPDLMQKFGMARQATREEENLFLCFVGPRNHLGMPYELLFEQDWLATRYPVCRQITGVPTRALNFGDFLAQLRREKQSLRVLLIASDTGRIDADEEVRALEEQIRKTAEALRVPTEVCSLSTQEAVFNTVDRLLEKCRYHIVHYAGHGFFDAATGEESGLIFWQTGERREKARLTARALAQRLRDSETVLFYLSSCVGATVGGAHLLRGNDYLGVMDAIVQAGVPIVLGYRWHVTDQGARQFAALFYKGLLETQSPAKAVLRARREIYIKDATDETWMSPILVVQKL